MKKPWLLAVVGLLTIVFALGAVACSDDDGDDDTNGDVPTEAATEPMDDATEPADGTPSAAGPIDVTINPNGDATVAGSATISPTDAGGTEVVVDITGGLEEGDHLSHIHHGDCSDPTGEIHVNLETITAGADGTGSATTTDPASADGEIPPFEHYQMVPHYVAVHAIDGTVVGCGDVVGGGEVAE